jgi:hypothetical protein
MEIFEGLPTFVGGYNEEKKNRSDEVFQYHWSEDKWVQRNDLKLKVPRDNAAMFEVPKDLFGIC